MLWESSRRRNGECRADRAWSFLRAVPFVRLVIIPFPFAFSFLAFVPSFLTLALVGVVGVSSPRAGFLGHVGELVQQVLRECVICASLHKGLFIVNRNVGETLRERLESVNEELNLHQRWKRVLIFVQERVVHIERCDEVREVGEIGQWSVQCLFHDGNFVSGEYSTKFLHDGEEMPAGKAELMAATVAGPRLMTMAAWMLVRAFSHLVNSAMSYTNLANVGPVALGADLRGIVIVGRARIVGGVGGSVIVAGVVVPIMVEGNKMNTTCVQLSALKLGGVVKALQPGWVPNVGKGGHIEGGDNCDNECCHC
jgi:hypothetical protein